MLGVKQVEGVGGGEEVVELLIFHVAEQRGAIVVIVRGRVVEEVVGEGVAKWRRVLVVHGGTREACGRSTREPRERLVRQCRQVEGRAEGWDGGLRVESDVDEG